MGRRSNRARRRNATKVYLSLIDRVMSSTHIPINLFHILVVAPFFLYVAIVRGQLVPWIFSVLTGLGIVILVYHGYKTFIKWKAQSPSLWINAIHFFFVAPLLIYIGSKGYDTPRWAFELLALLGFGALGYHIYAIIMQIQEMGVTKKTSASASAAANGEDSSNA